MGQKTAKHGRKKPKNIKKKKRITFIHNHAKLSIVTSTVKYNYSFEFMLWDSYGRFFLIMIIAIQYGAREKK